MINSLATINCGASNGVFVNRFGMLWICCNTLKLIKRVNDQSAEGKTWRTDLQRSLRKI
jgi:hypothetical protein